MSERLERLQREIAAERVLALAELGLSFDSPLIVRGRQNPEHVIATRLARVPRLLHDEARMRMQAALVFMPWLNERRVAGGDGIIQTQERQVVA
jgi:hypothetical protein